MERRVGIPMQAAFLIASLVALPSCEAGDAKSRSVRATEIDSASVSIVTLEGDPRDLTLWSLGPDPVATIDGNAPPYLSRVEEVDFLSDAAMVVSDRQSSELHLFGASGNYLALVGRVGDGPGEFRRVTRLSVTPGDTVYAYDRRLRRISVFDRAGDFMRTFPVGREDLGFGSSGVGAWALDTDHLFLHRDSPYDTADSAPRPKRDQRSALLFGLDASGAVGAGPVEFVGGYSVDFDTGDGPAPFSNRPTVEVGPGFVAYSSGLEYEITLLNASLTPFRIIRWPGRREPLLEPEVAAAQEVIAGGLEPFRDARPDLVATLIEATFSPSMIPALRPAVGRVLIDEIGRLWVSRFLPSTDDWGEQSWDVLDAEGMPLGRLVVPAGARLAAVRSDRVALVTLDGFDVPHVTVYTLGHSPSHGTRRNR